MDCRNGRGHQGPKVVPEGVVPPFKIEKLDVAGGIVSVRFRKDVLSCIANALANVHEDDGKEYACKAARSLASHLRPVKDLLYGEKLGSDISEATGTPYSSIAEVFVDGIPHVGAGRESMAEVSAS